MVFFTSSDSIHSFCTSMRCLRSQLFRYTRACPEYLDFIERGRPLAQGLQRIKLVLLKKFYLGSEGLLLALKLRIVTRYKKIQKMDKKYTSQRRPY